MAVETPILTENKKQEMVLGLLKTGISRLYGKNISEVFCQSVENKPNYELHPTNWKPRDDMFEAMQFPENPILKETWQDGERIIIDNTFIHTGQCSFKDGKNEINIKISKGNKSTLFAILPADTVYHFITEDVIAKKRSLFPEHLYDLHIVGGMSILEKLYNEYSTNPERLKVKLLASTNKQNQLLISSVIKYFN